jgi:hypothetical protein
MIRKASKVPVYTMKEYRRRAGRLHLFLTLLLDGAECSTSCPGYFAPGKEPWYSTNRRLKLHQSVWMLRRRGKSLVPAGIQTLDHPPHSLITTPTALNNNEY